MSAAERERARRRAIAQALVGPHGTEPGIRHQAARELLDCARDHHPETVSPIGDIAARRCRGCGAELPAHDGPGRPRAWCEQDRCQRQRRDGRTGENQNSR